MKARVDCINSGIYYEVSVTGDNKIQGRCYLHVDVIYSQTLSHKEMRVLVHHTILR